MRLDSEGSETLRTAWGAIFSILTFILGAAYVVQKFEIMMARKDVDIISAIQEDYISDGEEFSNKHGFNFAIGLTS